MSNYQLFHNDLPDEIVGDFKTSISIDTETMGLNIKRDRLCLVQMKNNDNGNYYLIQIPKGNNKNKFKNLKKILENKSIVKIFHYARFDIAVINHYLGIKTKNIFCTKIASKLVRTYTDKHGLKDLISELINISIDKKEQSSNWSNEKLSENQIQYALNDVKYLFDLKKILSSELEKKSLIKTYSKIISFLDTKVELDLLGWDYDLFAH